jgi:hypothetical protein
MIHEQVKRLPKIAIWYDKDMFIAFLVGIAFGIVLGCLSVSL